MEARDAAEHFTVPGKAAYHQQPWSISSSVCVGGGAEAVITLCKGLPMEMFIVALFIVLKN